MVDSSRHIEIGSWDYWEVYLKRVWDSIYLKRVVALDYADMDEYIRDNHDILSEWQQEVYNWNTTDSYDDWLQDYEYPYGDYYEWDSDLNFYYDWDADDTLVYHWGTLNYTKEEMIERVINDFCDDFEDGYFEYSNGINDNRFRQLVGEYYDECVAYRQEREEARKPHWNCFSYYK